MTEQEYDVMLADAGNPETPAERLDVIFMTAISAILHWNYEMDLRRLLARNPNTAPKHLEWLALCHTEDVLDNPALLWLLLEDPTFPQSSVAVGRMAKFPHCPEAIKARARITAEQHQEAEEAGRSLYDYRGQRYTP